LFTAWLREYNGGRYKEGLPDEQTFQNVPGRYLGTLTNTFSFTLLTTIKGVTSTM